LWPSHASDRGIIASHTEERWPAFCRITACTAVGFRVACRNRSLEG
jgi:hypothetical protein